MRLDRIAIALRARESWEAVDLGTAMLRAWWRPVYAAWFTLVLPVALVLGALSLAHPLTAFLLLWWLKPLYDRVVLVVLSQAVFGATPRIAELRGQIRPLLRSSGLLGGLTLRRLDPARSFNLPVRQLELQRGKPARERERLLGRRAGGQATGLLYACMGFELIVVLSLNFCVDLLKPAGMPSTLTFESFFRDLLGMDESPGAAIAQLAFMFAAITIIEPLYVASGFALYLNRRTALEAWDLELAFRRMHKERPTHIRAAAAFAAVFSAALLAMAPDPAAAAAQETESKKIIREVLASPDFGENRPTKTWRPKQSANAQGRDTSMSTLLDILQSIGQALAELSRLAAYVAIAALLYVAVRLLLRFSRNPKMERATNDPASPPPETLFGLDVRLDSLPDNLAELAAQAAAKDARLALSLLYRGALATLMHRDHLRIEAGDTEGDCLLRVRRLPQQALADYFARLVAVWSQTAYGDRAPALAAIQELCTDWPRFFAPRMEHQE